MSAKTAAKMASAAARCPFLHKTPTQITATAPPTVLLALASKCPQMKRALSQQQQQQQHQQPDSTSSTVAECTQGEPARCSDEATAARALHRAIDGVVAAEEGAGRVASAAAATATAAAAAHSGAPAADADAPTTAQGVFDYGACFKRELDQKKRDNQYRVFKNVNREVSKYPRAVSPADPHVTGALEPLTPTRDMDVWCSNDYLGMSRHPRVIEAMAEALHTYGAGSGGTRNIGGTANVHFALEEQLAQLHRKDAGLIFNSCYAANEATLCTLLLKMGPDAVVFSDELNHASMIQGMRHAGAQKRIFRHNDLAHLEQLLSSAPTGAPKLVAFESLYSMSGTVAPIADIVALARKYNAITFMDEAHAVGICGERGAGVGEEQGAMAGVDLISATLGKAYGCAGGYIAGRADLVDTVRSFGAGFIFTTSMAPVLAAGALASVRHLMESGAERGAQRRNSELLKGKLAAANLPLGASATHIIPVRVGQAQLASGLMNELYTDHDIYLQAINYPTVPVGQEILRVVASPQHTEAMMDRLVDSLTAAWKNQRSALNRSSLFAAPASAPAPPQQQHQQHQHQQRRRRPPHSYPEHRQVVAAAC